MPLVVRPLTPERWADFESIFMARGCSQARNCWCMYYRRSGRVAGAGDTGWPSRERNQRDFAKLVDGGGFTGILGYRGKTPVGWLSFGPREDFAKLARSPTMKPVDAEPVWSVICFVIPKEFRGAGVARGMLQGAIRHARKHKAKWLEAYPVDKPGRLTDDALWFGTRSMYDAAGFEEVARRKRTRPVMRLRLRR
jgi:GNAT superfamily N-acetyltransferase